MKTTLTKMLGFAALGMTLLATTIPTWAGLVGTQQVSVSINQYATSGSGSMVGARYSADNQQHIGCSIQVGRYDAAPSVSCGARNILGAYYYCYSLNPRYVEAVQGMTDSSYISFERLNSSTACTNLMIYDGSDQLR